MKSKRGQVWVETVIYTLIALVLIGTVLAFAKPKIQEVQDKAIIDQTVEVMDYIDSTIFSAISGGTGNSRTLDVGIKKGSLEIDGLNDKIMFVIEESKSQYSQPDKVVQRGNVQIVTTKTGGTNKVVLSLDYSEKYNVTYAGKDQTKSLSKSPTPYKLYFSNDGVKLGQTKTSIDTKLI
jgi:type II secretory pathway pseudopilin PulG